MVEYDKIHYPLPLILDINPDIDQLKNIIKKLRSENEDLKSNKVKNSSLGISQNNFISP